MPIITADCPRCGVQKMTFDAKSISRLPDVNYGWQQHAELFCVCRDCGKSTIFVTQQTETDFKAIFAAEDVFHNMRGSLNAGMKVLGHISAKDRASTQPPDHLPADVAKAFREGAVCMTVQCWNAAGAMFRKALDGATRPLLPTEETAGLNSKTRRDLGLRIPWLIAKGLLPAGLAELAQCVREDGNDGVHAHELTEEDALDLQDFTAALLERLFTEPEKLKLAEQRRVARRNAASG